MRVDELMRYTQAFYPNWDQAYADRLREEFQLPERGRIKSLSRGETAKAGLLIALAHRPDLLLLDEPSSGLDPIARKDILAAVVRSVAEEGRTVVFSSHLLDEVERVADHVAMLHDGAVTLDAPLDDIKAAHRRYVVRWPDALLERPNLPGILRVVGEDREWEILCVGDEVLFIEAVHAAGGEVLEASIPALETIFVARASA